MMSDEEFERELVERAATILMNQVLEGEMVMVPFSAEAARFCVRPIVSRAITSVAAHLHLRKQESLAGVGGRPARRKRSSPSPEAPTHE